MLLLLSFACATDPGPELAWVSPAVGQTGVPENLPLRVGIAGAWPEDYPTGGAIEVWDADGALVAGEVDLAGSVVFFLPETAWINDATYVWRWGFDGGAPHAPTGLPSAPEDHVMRFQVGGAVEVLGVALAASETPCVVTSAPGGTVPFDRLRVRGQDVAFFDVYRYAGTDADVTEPYPDGDPGLDVVCLATATPLDAFVDEPVVVNYAGRSWTGPLQADVGDLVASLRRVVRP